MTTYKRPIVPILAFLSLLLPSLQVSAADLRLTVYDRTQDAFHYLVKRIGHRMLVPAELRKMESNGVVYLAKGMFELTDSVDTSQGPSTSKITVTYGHCNLKKRTDTFYEVKGLPFSVQQVVTTATGELKTRTVSIPLISGLFYKQIQTTTNFWTSSILFTLPAFADRPAIEYQVQLKGADQPVSVPPFPAPSPTPSPYLKK